MPSLYPAAMCVPQGEKAQRPTSSFTSGSARVPTISHLSRLYNLTYLVCGTAKNAPVFGEKDNRAKCLASVKSLHLGTTLSMVFKQAYVSTSHILTVPSQPEDATYFPFGSMATLVTGPRWPTQVCVVSTTPESTPKWMMRRLKSALPATISVPVE